VITPDASTPTETAPDLPELEPGLQPETETIPDPSETPTVEPTAPTDVLVPVDVEPAPQAEPTPEVTEEPPPPPPPPGPTDYGIASVVITNDDSLLQHRYTVGISAETDGRPIARDVTVRIAFRRSTIFRGVVSPGWSCGDAVRNRRLTTLTCTTSLRAGEGTTFIAKARSLGQSGVISVSSTEDPNPGNDSQPFRAPLWLPTL